MMIDGYLLNMRVFDKVNDDKHQMLKPLEEAAEVFGAWQESDSMRPTTFKQDWVDMRNCPIDKCMDTVQAVANLHRRLAQPRSPHRRCRLSQSRRPSEQANLHPRFMRAYLEQRHG